MVGDYRALNTTTQPDRCPSPFLNNFADMLHGCTVYSKLDCYKNYYQIPMAAEDAHKTAIITLVGLYECKMMPFGLRNSSNTYQQYIDQVTRNLPFCFAYVDDIFVASHAMAQHEQHLRLLLDRFKQSGVVLNKEKCEIAVTNLTFLGHHISANDLNPSNKKCTQSKHFPNL